MTDRELMQMALDAFELECRDLSGNKIDLVAPAIKALRDRLAQPEPEPVSWNGKCVLGHCGSPSGCDDSGCCRATPPKREWVGLTDEEVGGLTVFDGLTHIEVPIIADLIRAVQSKLKEKNT